MTEEKKYFTYIDTQTGKEDIKEIIIDGVNVAGCKYLCTNQMGNNCLNHNQGFSMNCKNTSDCYYKQLQRLKQENEKLKNKNICRETCEYFKRICNKNTLLIKYRSILEEIRDILKHRPYLSNGEVKHIVRRIDEVLNENTEN